MLKVRLMKPGKSVKRQTHFKIVVVESAKPRDSSFIEQVGYYNPSRKMLKVDISKYEGWVKKGAQPTATVSSLVKRYKRNKEGKQ